MIGAAIGSIIEFKLWLRDSGRGYLEDGLGDWSPGAALFEIARRAGVRGLHESDSIVDTLPMVRGIIAVRCPPRRARAES